MEGKKKKWYHFKETTMLTVSAVVIVAVVLVFAAIYLKIERDLAIREGRLYPKATTSVEAPSAPALTLWEGPPRSVVFAGNGSFKCELYFPARGVYGNMSVLNSSIRLSMNTYKGAVFLVQKEGLLYTLQAGAENWSSADVVEDSTTDVRSVFGGEDSRVYCRREEVSESEFNLS